MARRYKRNRYRERRHSNDRIRGDIGARIRPHYIQNDNFSTTGGYSSVRSHNRIRAAYIDERIIARKKRMLEQQIISQARKDKIEKIDPYQEKFKDRLQCERNKSIRQHMAFRKKGRGKKLNKKIRHYQRCK